MFSLAAVALGLGNLFRLPWLIGEHGGGPFFLAYVISLLMLTVPVLLAEVMLGSFGRGSPLGAARWAADQSGRSHFWQNLGLVQALLAVVLAIEIVWIIVWMVDRAVLLQGGELAAGSARDFASSFAELIELGSTPYGGLALVLIPAAVLAAAGPGVAMGALGWLGLPCVALALLTLAGYSLDYGALRETEEYLFRRDPAQFDINSIFAALTSATITLGAGLGVGLCFGGRAPRQLPLARSVLASAMLDTLFMLLLAVVIVPLLYSVNVEPAEGVSLVFVAIPYAFANLPLGEAYGALFFYAAAAASFAALVALLEPSVMILRRELEWPRWWCAVVIVGVVWLLAVVVSGNSAGRLAVLDAIVAVLLPLSLLALSIFVGWFMPRPLVRGELHLTPKWFFVTWWLQLRWVVPTLCCALILWRLAEA